MAFLKKSKTLVPYPYVSILLPVRNEETLIKTAIDSILCEKFPDFELVVIDDGSTDQTPSILKNLAKDDKRLLLFQTQKQGLATALNFGLQKVRGEILLRMDADDISLPGRMTRQVEFLEKHPEVGVLGGKVIVEGLNGEAPGQGMLRYIKWQNQLLAHEEICRDLFVESPIVHPSIAIRTKFLREIGGYRDGDFPEDYDLFFRLLIGKGGVGDVGSGIRAQKLPGEPVLIWRDRITRFTRQSPRCRPEAIQRLKVEYLLQSYLRNKPDVVIWGAGLRGKPLARALLKAGLRVRAFIDIDPRKLGQIIHGAPVRPPQELSSLRGCFLIPVVGAVGARAVIRKQLPDAGFFEGENTCFIA